MHVGPDSPPERVSPATVGLLVVPNGSHRPAALAGALRRFHPDWQLRALWCGDPQCRPAGDLWHQPPVQLGRPWELVLAGNDAPRAEWIAGLSAIEELLRHGATSVVMLTVGAVAVHGPLDALTDPDSAGLVVPHSLVPVVDDGRAPCAAELARNGRFTISAARFGQGAMPAVGWLAAQLGRRGDKIPVGRWVELAAAQFGWTTLADDRIGAGVWRWPDRSDPALVDAPAFDAASPWVLDPSYGLPARVDLVGAETRQAVMAAVAEQLAGSRTALTLPGNITIDETIRELVAGAPDSPAPWSEAAAFRAWLEQYYWSALHARRRDLAAAFPEPVVADRAGFDHWCRSAFVADAVPFLVRHRPTGAGRLRVCEPLRADGLNLVGYLTRESSLGDVARRLHAALDAAHVPTSTVAHQRTASPSLAGAPPADQAIRFATTLAVVNADQFAALRMDHPELFAATERMIGYWFWELEEIPRAMRQAISLVDEIWAGSRFVADAFGAVADVPVRHVPIPVPAPTTSALGRGDFAPLAAAGERPLFLVALDHFSITERKNPIGAIRAFCQAFRPDEGPVLVVKSMNGARRWLHHQQVVAAAQGRPDIVIWDEHLSRPDQMSLVAAADCLVSLHRSEGLGLHLAEAMWLGTPTIATRYSGNLDFQDDDCALLIDAGRVRVTDGQGVYPETATWAEPDIGQAADAMRRVAFDTALRQRIAAVALGRMKMQPTPADTGRRIQRLLHGGD